MFSLQIEPSSETEWLEWVASNGEGGWFISGSGWSYMQLHVCVSMCVFECVCTGRIC